METYSPISIHLIWSTRPMPWPWWFFSSIPISFWNWIQTHWFLMSSRNMTSISTLAFQQIRFPKLRSGDSWQRKVNHNFRHHRRFWHIAGKDFPYGAVQRIRSHCWHGFGCCCIYHHFSRQVFPKGIWNRRNVEIPWHWNIYRFRRQKGSHQQACQYAWCSRGQCLWNCFHPGQMWNSINLKRRRI